MFKNFVSYLKLGFFKNVQSISSPNLISLLVPDCYEFSRIYNSDSLIEYLLREVQI